MDFDGGSPYFRDSGIKKEDGQGLFDTEPCLIIGNHDGGYYANFVDNDVNNHNRSVLSISERGDNTKCRLSVAVPPLCLTTCAGISPSALLESPVMIPTDQGKTNNELCTNNLTTDMNDEVGRERIANPNPEKRHKVSSGFAKSAEDGYSWRKYGQKDVKRSQLPRSYYRCRTMNCPVKKFVERSLEDGSIIQIIYKGKHNHSAERGKHGTCVKAEVEGSPASNQDLGDDDPMHEQLESNLDLSRSLAADEEDEGGGGPSDSRKRKRDIFPSEDALERSSRDPRVIVQVKSETTILDDGYRWRKYGQKVVKGNHNPRSYYKCTTQGCPVRKQVERASNDATSVITTYDGKHTHEVPSTKSNNGNLTIASTNSTAASPKQDFSRSPSQILPSYNPPLFSYNEFMNANLPLNIPPPVTAAGNLNLLPFSSSPSSSYQFPQFHSLPYASLSNISGNSHVRRTYQSSSSSSPYSSYPMIPDFMSLPTQINQRVPNVLLPNFGFSNNNYAPLSLSGRNLQAQQPAVQLKNNEVVRSTDGV